MICSSPEVIKMKQSRLGSFIRSMRHRSHMTQAMLAEKLNVTDKAVSKWERDVSLPDISLFPKLADVLGVTVNDLLNECAIEGQPSRLTQIFEMSHDIRTPLHIILGCADMAETYHDDPALLFRYLESIRVSGRYLLEQIDRAMQTTYLEPDELNAKARPANISDLDEYLQNPSAERGTAAEKRDFSGKRVLVAEDIELNREIAREILRQTGAETEFAENGRICVDRVTAAPAGYYDLILMDIKMPVLDGLEATRQIRALEDAEKASIPIIAMSANVYEKDRAAAFEAGMNAFTEKPVDVDRLFAAMAEYLS